MVYHTLFSYIATVGSKLRHRTRPSRKIEAANGNPGSERSLSAQNVLRHPNLRLKRFSTDGNSENSYINCSDTRQDHIVDQIKWISSPSFDQRHLRLAPLHHSFDFAPG